MSSSDGEWTSGGDDAPAGSTGKSASAAKEAAPAKRHKRKPKKRVETQEQKESRLFGERLKAAAIKSGVVSRAADAGDSHSASDVPSALRLDACNVIKRNSAKKIKFLFQLPSIFIPKGDAPIEIGSLHGLHSKHPVMFLKLPSKVLKLRGCVVYAKTCSYINLAKMGYDVKVEDTFDSVIVWGEPEIVESVNSAMREAIPPQYAAAADVKSLESSQEELLSSQSQDMEEDEQDAEDDDQHEKAYAPKPERQSARAAALPRRNYIDLADDNDLSTAEVSEDDDDDDDDDGEFVLFD